MGVDVGVGVAVDVGVGAAEDVGGASGREHAMNRTNPQPRKAQRPNARTVRSRPEPASGTFREVRLWSEDSAFVAPSWQIGLNVVSFLPKRCPGQSDSGS